MKLTTFNEGVNIRVRGHSGTCDDRKVGNWVRAFRGGDKEGAGILTGLEPGGRRIRGRGTGGVGRSARGG